MSQEQKVLTDGQLQSSISLALYDNAITMPRYSILAYLVCAYVMINTHMLCPSDKIPVVHSDSAKLIVNNLYTFPLVARCRIAAWMNQQYL